MSFLAHIIFEFQLGEIADELAKHLLTSSAYRRLLISLLLSRAASAWPRTPLPPAIDVLAARLIQQLEETGMGGIACFLIVFKST